MEFKRSKISFGRSKIEMLLNTNSIKRMNNGKYSVASFIVDSDGCNCRGFEKRGDCTHFQAVKRLESENQTCHTLKTSEGFYGWDGDSGRPLVNPGGHNAEELESICKMDAIRAGPRDYVKIIEMSERLGVKIVLRSDECSEYGGEL